MKYVRDAATSESVDAPGLLEHETPTPSSPALSLPRMQPNGIAHVGQPVPTYRTVLLDVVSHVDSVSTSPRATSPPKNSAYTIRGPGKNDL